MTTRIVALIMAAVLISGCSLRLPGIGIDIGDGGGGPPHCPPVKPRKGDARASPTALGLNLVV